MSGHIRFAACTLLALCAVGTSLAADPAPRTPAPRPSVDYKDPFNHVAAIISALSQADMDTAYHKYAERLIDAPKDVSEFENDLRTSFRRLFDRFPKGVETVDLMGIRRLSTRSFKMTCVANSRRGPIVVEAVVYRYGENWWFCQLGYQSVDVMTSERLKHFAEQLPAESFIEPLSIPVVAEPPAKVSSTGK